LLEYAEDLALETTVSQNSAETASDDAGNGDPPTYAAAHAALTVTPRFGAVPTVEQESGVEPDDTSAGTIDDRILETELVVHLIRPGTPEPAMFNIFVRINTGGRPLTRQELRHALIPGPARDLLRDLASAEPFLRATLGSVSPKRMDDREMVLRFVAFRSTGADKYRPEFDEFLRVAMKDANKLGPAGMAELRNDFNRAMDSAHQVFGGHAFRKRYPGQTRRSPINKALFESIAVNLAELSDSEIDTLARRRDDVLEKFSELLDTDPEFDRSISVATGDAAKVRFRFEAIRQLFKEMPPRPGMSETLKRGSRSLRDYR
jgi:hypothetical protein